MKAQLTFDLDDLDDERAHLRCVKSLDMALILWELVNNTKKRTEQEIECGNISGYEISDYIFDQIIRELDTHGIVIDDLVI